MPTTPAELVESAFAAHRLTRLVTDDRITRHPRRLWIEAAHHNRPWPTGETGEVMRTVADTGAWENVVDLDDDPPLAATWVVCPWCAGMWVTTAVTVLNALDARWWRPVRRVLALSSAAGLIAGHETP